MCGRYTLLKETTEIEQRFNAKISFDHAPKADIRPSNVMPILTQSDPYNFVAYRWGWMPEWYKWGDLINARVDTIINGKAYKGAIKSKRCIVPADGFYEWFYSNPEVKKNGIPHRFTLKDDILCGIAGLYSTFKDKKTGEPKETFLIITTDPNPLVAKLHDRMPVILRPDLEKAWLDPNLTEKEAIEMLHTYPHDLMEGYPVDKKNMVDKAGECLIC